jgi:nucleoside-diphosphate-sugar epimerase
MKENVKLPNILVTGATGFLGSHLTRSLYLSGYKIIISHRNSSSFERINDIFNKIVLWNIEKNSIDKLFCHNTIDCVIHCATNYGKIDPESSVFKSNIIFPLELLEGCEKYNVKMFINTDSYFNKKNLTYSALPSYSKTKKLFLSLMKNYEKKIPTILNLRLEHLYGEYDNQDKFIPYCFDAMLKDKTLDLTYGHQKRDFIHINDCTNAYSKIIRAHQISENKGYWDIEIGTGNSITLRNFVLCMKKITGSKSILNFGAVPYRSDEIMDSKADLTEFKKFLRSANIQMDAFIEPEVGIKSMIKGYKCEK